jgi:hypothetical protein
MKAKGIASLPIKAAPETPKKNIHPSKNERSASLDSSRANSRQSKHSSRSKKDAMSDDDDRKKRRKETEINRNSLNEMKISISEVVNLKQKNVNISDVTDVSDQSKMTLSLDVQPYIYYVDPRTKKECKFNIAQETINIGRNEENDLVLTSKYVSRFHARIDVETDFDGRIVFRFRDLSGRSRINGYKPIDHSLVKGDQIKVGKTLLLFLGH